MENYGKKRLTAEIRKKASDLAFDCFGIARARALSEREPILKKWIDDGMNDMMGYLAREPLIRLNPALLVPGAKSVIVTGTNYYSENSQKKAGVPVISRYSYGKDYHDIIIPKLRELFNFIKSKVPDVDGRVCCDSGQVHEKAWASEAGLGWQGRHSILINRDFGSYIFIGILILTTELDYDEPFSEDLCGECRLCIEACPTGAINNNRTIDTRKCIANLTLYKRGPIPPEIIPKLERRIYGCDKCQEVCPWNKRAVDSKIPEFKLPQEIAEMEPEDWLMLTKENFQRLFSGHPIGRKDFDQLKENIRKVMET
jgi:epoxyqueuosine reductase